MLRDNTMPSRIMLSAMLSAISPIAVCNAIAVVNTRVTFRMLPPSIIATPNSAKALLKAAKIAKTTPQNASRRTTASVWRPEAPRVLASVLTSGSTDSSALVVKLTIIGVTSTHWPIMMAYGV